LKNSFRAGFAKAHKMGNLHEKRPQPTAKIKAVASVLAKF
jgi:hypothetical protein